MVEDDRSVLLDQIVAARLASKRAEIEHSLRQIDAGNPYGAEPRQERLVKRIRKKTGLTARASEALSVLIERTAEQIDDGVEQGPEAIRGPTIDYVGVEFLTRGRLAANAVGRVVLRGGRAQGTGFLIGAGLFITNNHVMQGALDATRMLVEFDYEAGDDGIHKATTVFEFDPSQCFVSDPIEGLDYSVVAIGRRIAGGRSIDEFGYVPLSDASDKHALGEIANIVQHPLGQLKQIVVRENNLVSRDETVQVLHYLADTERGSSGSLVCNGEWEAIALHHWAGPALDVLDPQGRPLRKDINEGIRISAIVKSLRAALSTMDTSTADSVRGALALWGASPGRGPVAPRSSAAAETTAPDTPQARVSADGTITWIFPVEISVRAPLFSLAPDQRNPGGVASTPGIGKAIEDAAERVTKKRADFRDRGGYEAGFIPGFDVPMPTFDGVSYTLARNLEAPATDDQHELRYHHFSIVMNADRRLAAMTACNIDGSRLVAVDREKKSTNPTPTLRDLGVERLGAEGSDDFAADPRVHPAEQMAVSFYEEQVVPGFDKPKHPGKSASAAEKKAYARAMNERTARMFQKGHIIMRGDPAWGLESEAVAAEADTFFYTNAAPQIGFFNQGSFDHLPGSKGKLRWRAVESYVLRNALVSRQRLSVFAGPVFDDAYDVEYREGVLVPMRFWKIAVWAESKRLKAIALIADQKPVLEKLTEGVPEGFDWEVELERVSEFLTTVSEIERLTKLDFGTLRDADIRKGEEGLAQAADHPQILRSTDVPAGIAGKARTRQKP